jgi:hypothetical protein
MFIRFPVFSFITHGLRRFDVHPMFILRQSVPLLRGQERPEETLPHFSYHATRAKAM